MKQKLTSHLFFLIALTGSFFLSYSCECQDSLVDVVDRREIALNTVGLEALAEGVETTDSTLTFSLTPALPEDMMLSFTISGEGITREDFTLTAGSSVSQVTFADSTNLSGTLTIESGSANASLTLTVSDDDLDERVEEALTFTLNDDDSYSGNAPEEVSSNLITLNNGDSYSINPLENAVEVILIDNENRAEVRDLSLDLSSLAVTLTWTDPVDMDLDHVEISWMPVHGNPSSPRQISRGVQTLTITGLISETDYTFTAVGVDSAGNRASGVTTNGIPMNLLTNVHNVSDSGTLELDGAFSVTTASVGGTTYLFAAGFSDNGVSVFRVGSGGTLSNVHNVSDGGALNLRGAISVTTASVEGETYLFVAGFSDHGISVFRVESDGDLVNVENVSDSVTRELLEAVSVTTASVGGTTYLFAVGFSDDGVSVFRVESNGKLVNVENVSDSVARELDGASSVTTASVGGATYLFVGAFYDSGVSVFRVESDGKLINVENVSDLVVRELDGAYSVTTASVGAETYLFVAGFNDDSVSVFRVQSDGTLVNVHNVLDEDALELDGARYVTTASVGAETYLFVVGFIDHGLSILHVQSDGTLVNVENVSDSDTLELLEAASVTTASVGAETYLFVAGSADNGVSVFRVGPAASE